MQIEILNPRANCITENLVAEVKDCKLCADDLPLGPRPVLQINSAAKILIAGQAPGRKVHQTGIPFNDASGDRLREWMGVTSATFYNAMQIAILPMGFCYPGTGKSGDLPPRAECAIAWRPKLLAQLPNLQLTLLTGQYALAWHLNSSKKLNLTDTVKAWLDYFPETLVLPHPSPRNNIWLKRNGWFTDEVLPVLKARVSEILSPS